MYEFFLGEKLADTTLNKMRNGDIIQYLTQIKGVGLWTAEMIRMLTLGREDIFAVHDLGIQQSFARLYERMLQIKKH